RPPARSTADARTNRAVVMARASVWARAGTAGESALPDRVASRDRRGAGSAGRSPAVAARQPATPSRNPRETSGVRPPGPTAGSPAPATRRRSPSWSVATGRLRAGSGLTGFSPDGRWVVGPGSLLRVGAGPAADTLAAAKLRSFRAGVFSADSRLIALTTLSG